MKFSWLGNKINKLPLLGLWRFSVVNLIMQAEEYMENQEQKEGVYRSRSLRWRAYGEENNEEYKNQILNEQKNNGGFENEAGRRTRRRTGAAKIYSNILSKGVRAKISLSDSDYSNSFLIIFFYSLSLGVRCCR